MIFSAHNVHPAVGEAAYKRFLRMPLSRSLDGPLAENAAWAREWFATHARPWLCAAEVRVAVAPDGLQLAGRRLGDGALAARFTGATAAAIVAVSAGPELEAEVAARWEAGEPDRYYFLDAYAAAVVQALLAGAGARLEACAGGRTVLPYYCPGYRGWPIGETVPVLAALEAAGALPGELAALESGMLRPKKSQLALFGLKPGASAELEMWAGCPHPADRRVRDTSGGEKGGANHASRGGGTPPTRGSVDDASRGEGTPPTR